MKIILSTLNSKFIHTNLAIRYLKNYVRDLTAIDLLEFNINQNRELIISEIYRKKPDLIGFSTYIWNLEETLRIAEAIKIILPQVKIILGGPEVSYDGEEILERYSFIDFIAYGEGEETFRELISVILEGSNNFSNIKGLIYRDGLMVIKTKERPLIKNLDSIPSPYENTEDEYKDRIVYYESSRGCPFNCEFCLSSTIKGVRYFNIERVKSDLELLINLKVNQIKFVDRTFNANKKYAMEIMKFIIQKNPENINFHFEVTAHLLDDEMMQFLSQVKEGLFQFEVGVQSTNQKTIEAIGRTTNFERLQHITKKIKSYNNIHQHLDLIAGLPYEDYDSFKKSFNDVYDIRPEKIQLGFLKLLKGSGLRAEEKKYGFKYLDSPPYEILENKFITYGELMKLKIIEDMVERYYNEGYFEHSLQYIIDNYFNNPFEFYEDLALYWVSNEYHKLSHSRTRLYEILMDYYGYKGYKHINIFKELVKYDFLLNNKKSTLPRGLSRIDNSKIQKKLHDILKNEEILKYFSDYRDLPTKKLVNKVLVEGFEVDVLKIVSQVYNEIDTNCKTYIMFVYRDGSLNRCNSYDITKIVREMI